MKNNSVKSRARQLGTVLRQAAKGAVVPCVSSAFKLVLIWAYAQSATAQPIISEEFEYPTGSISGKNGGLGFSAAFSGSGSIVSGSLTYSDSAGVTLAGGGNSARIANSAVAFRSLSSLGPANALVDANGKFGADNTRLYLAFLVSRTRFISAPSYGGISLYDGAAERMYFGQPYDGTTWGIDTHAPAGILSSGVSSASGTHLLVARFDFAPGAETIRLYVDPPLGIEPSTPTVGPVQVPDLRFNRVRLAAGGADFAFDEFTFAVSYAGALGAAPLVRAITTQPAGQTITVGASLTLKVVATGNPPLSYQWMKDGVLVPGATADTLTISNASPSDQGSYTVVVSDQGGSLSSEPAFVTVLPAVEDPGARYSIGLNFGADQPDASLSSTALAGVPEIAQANWNNLSGSNGSFDALVAATGTSAEPTLTTVFWNCNNLWSSTGFGEENNGFSGADRTLMSGYLDTESASSTTVTLSNLPPQMLLSGYDVYVYTLGGVAGRGGSYRVLDGASGTVLKDYVRAQSLLNPSTYVEAVPRSSSSGWPSGTYVKFSGLNQPIITVEATPAGTLGSSPDGAKRAPINAIQVVARTEIVPPLPPSIITHPLSQEIVAGDTLTLKVTAIGTEPIAYQWQRNGEPISGAKENTLIVANTRESDAGSYVAVVTNAAGMAQSKVALVTVRVAPTTPNAVNQTPPHEVWRVHVGGVNGSYTLQQPLMAEDVGEALIVVATRQPKAGSSGAFKPGLIVSKVLKDGSKAWESEYDEPYGRPMTAESLALDPRGNIIVAGSVDGELLFVMKFDARGQRLWASAAPSLYGASRLFVDSSDRIITWTSGEAPSLAWPSLNNRIPRHISEWARSSVAILSKDGQFLQAPFEGRGGALAAAELVGGSELIQASWERDSSDTGIFAVSRLNLATGERTSTNLFRISPTNVVVRSSFNRLFVAHLVNGIATIQSFAFDGAQRWTQTLTLPGLPAAALPALEVDEEGNSFFAAIIRSSQTDPYDCVVYRLNPAGNVSWTSLYSEGQRLRGLGFPSTPPTVRLKADRQGGVFVIPGTGKSEITHISANGLYLWTERDYRSSWNVSGFETRGTAALTIAANQDLLVADRQHWTGGLIIRRKQASRILARPVSPLATFESANTPLTEWSYGLLDTSAPANSFSRPFEIQIADGGAKLIETGNRHPWFLGSTNNEAASAELVRPDGFVYALPLFPNEVTVHGSPGRTAAVRWRAPSTGIYRLFGSFEFGGPLNSGSSAPPPRMQIRAGEELLKDFTWSRTTHAESAPFDLSVELSAGQTLDFIFQFTWAEDPGLATRSDAVIRVEVSQQNSPPTVRVLQPEAGTNLLPGGPLVVELDVRDPDSSPGLVEVFFDGSLVRSFTAPPFRFELPAPSPGYHDVRARALDGDRVVWSESVRVVTREANEVYLTREELQQALFVALSDEKLREGEETEEGLINSVMMDAIASIRRELPNLPPRYYLDFVDGVRAELAKSRSKLTAFTAGKSSRPPEKFDTLKQIVRNVIVPVADNIGIQWGPVSIPVGKVVTGLAQTYGQACDAGATSFGCKVMGYAGFRKENLEVIQKEARQDPAFREVVYYVEKEVGTKPDLLPSQYLQAIDRLGGQMSSGFDQIRGDVRGLSQSLNELLDGQEGMRVDLNLLLGMGSELNASMLEGFGIQQQMSAQILQVNQDILGMLTDQKKKEEMLAEQARLAAEHEKIEKAELARRGQIQLGFSVLTRVLGMAGENGKQLARQMDMVGNQALRVYDLVTKYNKLTDPSFLATAAFTGNLIAVGFELFNALSSPEISSPSPEQVLIEQLGVVKEMITRLGEQMHDRFDRVDKQLNDIYTNFSVRFSVIDQGLATIQSGVSDLQYWATRANQLLDTIQFNQYDLARAAEYAVFTNNVNIAASFSPGGEQMSYEFTYVPVASSFYTFGSSMSRDPRYAPVNLSRDTVEIPTSIEVAGGLTGALNYLAQLANANNWPTSSALFGEGQPNLTAWKTGADAYVSLVETWPVLARKDPNTLLKLKTLQSIGENARGALQELVLLRSGTANREFWNSLIQFYRAKGEAFLQQVERFPGRNIPIFEQQQRTNLLWRIDESLNRQLAAAATDFWGGTEQFTGFEPPFFAAGKLPYVGGTSRPNNGQIDMPDGLARWYESSGGSLPVFANFLGLANLDAYYFNTDLVDVNVRRTCSGTNYADWSLPYEAIVYESRLALKVGFRITLGGGNQVYPAEVDYRHPDRHLHEVKYTGGPNGVFVKTWQYGVLGYPVREIPPTSGPFGSIAFPVVCNVMRMWPDAATQFSVHWNGGNERDRGDTWATILDTNPIRSIRRETFKTFAVLTNLLDRAIQDPFSTSTPRAQTTVRRLLEQRVARKLREMQRTFYLRLSEETSLANRSQPIGRAAAELDGARAALQAYVKLAFPDAYEGNDALRSCFDGEEALPGSAELRTFCQDSAAMTEFNLDHRTRFAFGTAFQQRLLALTAAINERLDEAARNGKAETLPVITETLSRISDAQTLLSTPLRITPTLNWAAPGGIVYGTPLGATHLNATAWDGNASVSGTFVYTPAPGTILPAGTSQPLRVTFMPADTSKYSSAAAMVSITVSPAPLQIVANDKTKIYGEPVPSLSASFLGFVDGDSEVSLQTPVALSTSATTTTPSGSYPILLSGGTHPNYNVTRVNGAITVMPAPLTVRADNKTVARGQPIPPLTATYSGFVNGDGPFSLTTPLSLTTSATASSPAGNYAIIASGATSPNYQITYVPGILAIQEVITDVTHPADRILVVGTSGEASPVGEEVMRAIDNNPETKYLNFEKVNSGFIVFPSRGSTVVTGLTLTSANDEPARDPASFVLSGSNDDGATFFEIVRLSIPPFSGRFAKQTFTFANETSFARYRLIFPAVANPAVANSMQIAEVELLGAAAPRAGRPELRAESLRMFGGRFEIVVSAPAGARVRLEGSTDLKVWSEVATQNVVLATGTTFSDQGETLRFYRAVLIP